MNELKIKLDNCYNKYKNQFLSIKKQSNVFDKIENGNNHSLISEKFADEITSIINDSDVEYNSEVKDHVTKLFQDFGRLLL